MIIAAVVIINIPKTTIPIAITALNMLTKANYSLLCRHIRIWIRCITRTTTVIIIIISLILSVRWVVILSIPQPLFLLANRLWKYWKCISIIIHSRSRIPTKCLKVPLLMLTNVKLFQTVIIISRWFSNSK